MDGEKASYVVPTKKIKTIADMKRWEMSDAYQEYVGFIEMVGDSIKGKKIGECVVSEDTERILKVLDTLSSWVDDIEPLPQAQRFGNKAFRDWHQRLTEKSAGLVGDIVGGGDHEAIKELDVYFRDSFGNATRIDYGTGHEMAFVMFLAGLFRARVLSAGADAQSVGLAAFHRYACLARKLQLAYRMEPAGSQGVWSLDDYQFVGFVWGAAQLAPAGGRPSPRSIPDYDVAATLRDDNHLFACVDHIAKVKSGPFAEHSNQLWNISAVPTWAKVYAGLVKMYKAEVLSKFPVIQHVYFGSIFRL